MIIDIMSIIAIISLAFFTALQRSLLKGAIGLAFTSALLTVLLFRLSSPLAAVFELSICAGLITVVFISTISLAEPLSYKDLSQRMKGRYKRYLFMPVLVVVLASLILWLPDELIQCIFTPAGAVTTGLANGEAHEEVRNIIWNHRELDILGQITILLTGVFGVVLLFKERKNDE